ncbi:uncharacterized protein LOC141616975 [Silene latifolia]|uniref:uncharacterized protein LOC141616975 n=1 Tax=Silene latifolia TaxID=37657 RepID=UPI003D779B02
MNCVTTVSYEILFNGKPLPQFRPLCGLRQGDPLSPYLFILCMEVLATNIDVAHEVGRVHSFSLCRGVRPITHLFFADDSVFFFKDKGHTAANLMSLINDYCEASGQRLNLDKSDILFSPNTTLTRVQKLLRTLQIRNNKGIGKYLGIPAEFQESKKGIFKALVDHITKRKNVHWCSKNFLSFPKSAGGLGIRNIECLNKALLAKHGWRLISGDSSLFSRIFRRKLFGTEVFTSFRDLSKGTGASWGIRSILHGLQLIRDRIGWKPGRASNLNVWLTRWVGGEYPDPKDCWLGINDVNMAHLQVRHLLMPNGGWNEPYIRTIFTDEFAARILAIPIPPSRMVDKVFWPLTKDGCYSVKSGYGLLFDDYMTRKSTRNDRVRISDRGREFCRKNLWHLPVPSTWKILVWRILTNTLPVGKEFQKRNLAISVTCGMCGVEEENLETVEHIFRDCSLSARVWAGSILGIRVENAWRINITDWIKYLSSGEDGKRRVVIFMTVLWGLWAIRNKAKFDNVSLNSHVISGFFFGLIREKAHLLSDLIEGSGSLIGSRKNRETGRDDMKAEIKEGYPLQLIGKQDRCDVIRVQVDASWNRNYDAAFGWVATDWRGCEVMRRQKRIKAESALQAEALGVRDVLLWASSGGFLHIQISSDCLQLINELAGADGKG